MPDLLDRLKTALADRYAIEREIGAGGMAMGPISQCLADLSANLAPLFFRERRKTFQR